VTLHAPRQPTPGAAADMRPLSFAGLFGWLHRPSGLARDTGVVLVSPLGGDAISAHMPMRLFADQLAGMGFPALRYDHPGQGDSLPIEDADADALPLWLDGVAMAVETLRARTGVRRVVLGGVRMGASLAVAAAPSMDVDALLLLAPVLDGGSWLRRLRFSGGVFAPREAVAGPAPFDADGLWLSAATTASLGALRLATLPTPTVPTFLAAQNKLVDVYAEHLLEAGAPVEVSDFGEFEAMFQDSHCNLPPLELFERLGAWLAGIFPVILAWPTAVLGDPPPAAQRTAHGTERAVTFGGALQGVLMEPDYPRPGAPAVLFCNTGGDPRAGRGGFAAHAARVLAADGIASLRFDFAGLGDSPAPGEARTHVFETPREADMAAALDRLDRGAGVAVVGVCAGAYHAVRAAADPRVRGVFAISPVKLVWRPGDTATRGRSTQAYMADLRNPAAWRRLFGGEVDAARLARTLITRLAARLGKRLEARLKTSLAPGETLRAMRAFAARGGRVAFLMGLNDTSLLELELHFGAGARRLLRLPGATMQLVPDLDHGLVLEGSRRTALAAIRAWLAAAPPAS
jgi:alpha-beta hydrolase superfamily lysophospholipase